MTDPALLSLDLSGWDQISPPPPAAYPLSLSISPSGHINLGDRLRNEMQKLSPELTFQFLAQPDRKILALVPSAEGYRFPKSGRIKDLAFTQSLVAAGIPLLARYQVAWNPQAKAWVAYLVSPTAKDPATALKASLTARSSRKKSASHA